MIKTVSKKSIKFALLTVSALGTGVFAGGLPQGGVVQEGVADFKYAGGGGGVYSHHRSAIG